MVNKNYHKTLKTKGFTGFVPIKELYLKPDALPNEKGVYLVLRSKNTVPEFLPSGSGGWYKAKTPM